MKWSQTTSVLSHIIGRGRVVSTGNRITLSSGYTGRGRSGTSYILMEAVVAVHPFEGVV